MVLQIAYSQLKKALLVPKKSFPLIFTSAFLICLAAYAYIGSFMRLSGDDYCYAAHLNQGSFWQAQVNSYLEVSTYNANRFSSTLFSGLVGLFPPVVNGFLPGVVIFIWLVGLVFALRMVFQTLKLQVPLWLCILLAAFIEFVVFYQAPDIGQSLYWRSGMLPYTLPIVGNTYLFAMLLGAWKKDRVKWSSGIAIFLLAFISGGFSEVGIFFQIAWLGLIWLVTWIFDRRTQIRSPRITAVFLIAVSATLLAPVFAGFVSYESNASWCGQYNAYTVPIFGNLWTLYDQIFPENISRPTSANCLFYHCTVATGDGSVVLSWCTA